MATTTTSNLAADATQMLAAALEQMDDIIAGTRFQSSEISLHNGTMDSHNANFQSAMSVNHFGISQLADELKQSVELAEDQGEAGVSREGVPDGTRQVLIRWLQGGAYQANSPPPVSSNQIQRLESDKESLVLQMTILNDQLEAQAEAIEEMEKGLAAEKAKLAKTEAMLQEEMTVRAQLETAKLDQMGEVSNLRIRLSSVENDLAYCKERAIKAENLLEEKQLEASELDIKYQQSQTKISDLEVESNCWQEKYMQSQAENERLRASERKNSSSASEVEKLKRAIESLLAAANEKDTKIEELRKANSRHKKVQELMVNAQGRKVDSGLMDDDPLPSDSFSTTSSVSMPDTEDSLPKKDLGKTETPADLGKAYLDVVLRVDSPDHTLTDGDTRLATAGGKGSSFEERNSNFQKRKSASLEDLKPGALNLSDPTPSIHHGGGYSTMPSPRSKTTSEGFEFLPPLPVTASSPVAAATMPHQQASTESDSEDVVRKNRRVNFADCHLPGTPPAERRKKKGIKKLFGKLKRSNSATLTFEDADDDSPVEFRRNNRFRATAGPRLGGWSGLNVNRDIDTPFAKWEGDRVAAWLHEMGLGRYMSMCRVWVKNGSTLLKASPLDLEKELGVKNVLHRKKLQLAIQAIGSEEEDSFSSLDHHWATRWLDDVGLPQYKDAFGEARIDGRMLHYLTVDDLLLMRVTSGMHHASIMRAVQCLRLHNFQPNCLRRRPTDEPYEAGREVLLWTNHRVMEWLRTVDLSEYAPNLRGSGIHGALMVLEPRFSSETLASTLCIPNSKSLLRRHLSTHFSSLVGSEIQCQKRDAEKVANFVPLSALTKVKPRKRPFTNRPKKRGMEEDDYLCPMNMDPPPGFQRVDSTPNGPTMASYRIEVRSASKVHRQDDETSASSPDSADGAAPSQIGVFSEEIDTLTSMLNENQATNGGTTV